MSRKALGPLRYQLASTSPVHWRGLGRALASALGARSLEAELEELLRRDHGVAGVFPLGSGTEALTWAMEAAERLSGQSEGPIALPAYSCFDVGAAASAFGRPIHLYDLDPQTLGPDPGSLREAIGAGASSVVISSLFGVPIDWTTLAGVLADGVMVIEDAAQGHGARWKGQRLGGFGRLGVLSFGRGKGWTGGAGGALLVRDHADVAVLRPHLPHVAASDWEVLARAVAHRVLGQPAIYRVPRSLPFLGLGETRYRPAREPRLMAPASSALLLESRARAENEVEARAHAAAEYRMRLERSGVGTPITIPAGGTAGYIRFPLLVERGIDAFADVRLAARLGAAPGYPAALGTLPAIASLLRGSRDWPAADRLVREIVTLPTHGLVGAGERRALLDLLLGRPS